VASDTPFSHLAPDGANTELAITETPTTGWQSFGPFGSGIVYLRAALVRLLWFAVNPASGSTVMPAGWVHGRLGDIAMITEAQSGEPCCAVSRRFSRNSSRATMTDFIAWIGAKTKKLAHAHGLAMRDADLETVIQFIQAQGATNETIHHTRTERYAKWMDPDSILLFTEETGTSHERPSFKTSTYDFGARSSRVCPAAGRPQGEREFVGSDRALAGIRATRKIQRSRPSVILTELPVEHRVKQRSSRCKSGTHRRPTHHVRTSVLEEIKTVQGKWDHKADPCIGRRLNSMPSCTRRNTP